MSYDNVRLIDFSGKEVYLKITKRLKEKLSKERKKQFKNMKELASQINEPESALISFFWQHHAISVRLFLKLVKQFGIESYEKEIKWIGGKTRGKGISNPKSPFNFNTKEGGMFVAAVLGDGTFLYNLEIQYRNYCPLMLKQVVSTARKLFGNISIVSKDVTSVLFPSILGKIIYELGLRPGRKTVTNPHIPEFVMNGTKECKIGFLKQISDDEGSPEINPPNSYSIRYEFAIQLPKNKFNEKEKYIPNLLNDLYELIKSFGFSTTRIYGGRVYKGRRKLRYCVSWVFDVQGKQSLEKFEKEINFRVPKRRKKLKWGLSKMKTETYGKKAWFIVLSKFYGIFKQQGFVTKHELSKHIRRTKRNGQAWLSKLESEGFIEQIGGNKFIGRGYKGLHGRTPAKYKITKKGINTLVNYRKNEDVRICPKYRNTKYYSPWHDN
jgi:hypothetical protein